MHALACMHRQQLPNTSVATATDSAVKMMIVPPCNRSMQVQSKQILVPIVQGVEHF